VSSHLAVYAFLLGDEGAIENKGVDGADVLPDDAKGDEKLTRPIRGCRRPKQATGN
jgi:hypothetical protein